MSPKPKSAIDKKHMTELERARKQNVAKRNDMIQKSKKSLSIVENKAVSYIFSKVKPEKKKNTNEMHDSTVIVRYVR